MTTNILSLEGKTAAVIGGTSGIGRTLSLGLADAGADVIASARRREQVDETATEIERRGRKTLGLCCDVCDRTSLEELLAAALQRFGKVDILINCAGKISRVPTLTMPEEEWADVVDTRTSPEPCAHARSSVGTCWNAATGASSTSRLSTASLRSTKSLHMQPAKQLSFRSRARLPWSGQEKALR
jgi:NAD(P)-dependent dehydrogenase (short-subunit alcohol dehydrogenase family)